MDLIGIHSADWHLGKNRKHEDYLVQQGFMLEGIVAQIAQTCKDNPLIQICFWLSGDIFDRNQDTRRAEFVLFLTDFIQPLLKLKRAYKNLSIYIIDGNHDRQPSTLEPSVLSPLVGLLSDYIKFAVVEPKLDEELQTLMLPYGGYSAKDMRALIEKYQPQFVMAHECLSRMQTDTGWSPPRDQDHYIEIDQVLPDTKVAGVFLGDIHRCQSMDEKQICWYSGSPVTLDHGHKPPKGLLHHFYKKSGSLFEQAKLPELKPLDDSRIKVHQQLGVLTDLEKIPWASCYNFNDAYLDLIVTPDVYAEINKKVSGFFTSKQVSWTFLREEKPELENSSLAEAEITQLYYSKAIKEWTLLNLPNFSPSLQDEFVGRAEKLFEVRG